MALSICTRCGFVQNDLFDPGLVDHTMPYEESQAFSGRFREFQAEIVDQLISDHDLAGSTILEIGCGKGGFLETLCRQAGARGIGIDPAATNDRLEGEADIHLLKEFFDDNHTHLTGKLICCRHTLEHIQGVGNFVELMRRSAVGTPEAVVFVEVPDTERILDEGAFWDVFYEHCSYFTALSLRHLFRSKGFEVTRLDRAFDDQYLLLESRVGVVDTAIDTQAVEDLVSRARSFASSIESQVKLWRDRIHQHNVRGEPVVLWAAGSKAVGFLSAIGQGAEVQGVVDINPFKQGSFLPGHGHEVLSPEALLTIQPRLVIVMNPVYLNEIRAALNDLGLHPELEALGSHPPTSHVAMAGASERKHRCSSCDSNQLVPFLSLGQLPLANRLVSTDRAGFPEERYPLTVAFCRACSLVQLGETVPPELIFTDTYPYYSSSSDSLVESSRLHVESLVTERRLGSTHTAVELASNDGYLLQWFLKFGLKVLGIDPSPGPARVAQEKGIPTRIDYFTTAVARELQAEGVAADVVVASNVLAHVSDLNDFVEGIALLLKADGVALVEFPYVRDLVEGGAFDTIYHEHRCYFSVHAIRSLFERHGLTLQRVEHLPQQGGSLRCTFGHERTTDSSVVEFLRQELEAGVTTFDYYAEFAQKVDEIAGKLRRLLTALKSSGARVVAYGAAAKGATLLNYVGIGDSELDYVVDRSPYKQGWLMPGVGLPIVSPERLLQDQPEFVLLLAWNLLEEVVDQQSEYLRRGGRLIVPIPEPEVLSVDR